MIAECHADVALHGGIGEIALHAADGELLAEMSEQCAGNSQITLCILEVQADFNGTVLYRRMREKREDMGIKFEQKEVKPGVVQIKVTK